MPQISEVEIAPSDPERFASVLDEGQMSSLREAISGAHRVAPRR